MHKTIFSRHETVSERSMSSINWEMLKEVHRFEEDEFYHVPDLQYYVHKIHHSEKQFGNMVLDLT